MASQWKAVKGMILATTDEVELYTCDANTTIIGGVLQVCNPPPDQSAYKVFLTGVDGEAGNLPVGPGGLNVITGPPQEQGVVLGPGQGIRVQGGVGLSFVLYGMEVTDA